MIFFHRIRKEIGGMPSTTAKKKKQHLGVQSHAYRKMATVGGWTNHLTRSSGGSMSRNGDSRFPNRPHANYGRSSSLLKTTISKPMHGEKIIFKKLDAAFGMRYTYHWVQRRLRVPGPPRALPLQKGMAIPPAHSNIRSVGVNRGIRESENETDRTAVRVVAVAVALLNFF